MSVLAALPAAAGIRILARTSSVLVGGATTPSHSGLIILRFQTCVFWFKLIVPCRVCKWRTQLVVGRGPTLDASGGSLRSVLDSPPQTNVQVRKAAESVLLTPPPILVVAG